MRGVLGLGLKLGLGTGGRGVGTRLGPNIMINGDFTDGTGWTLEEPATQTISGGALRYASTTAIKDANGSVSESIISVEGTITISGMTEGTIQLYVGDDLGSAITADGTYTEMFTSSGATTLIRVRPSGLSTTANIDNIIIRKVI